MVALPLALLLDLTRLAATSLTSSATRGIPKQVRKVQYNIFNLDCNDSLKQPLTHCILFWQI